ncbi:MAG: UDP-N-acetylmuramoyl-L-alanyl-D-glutamate--2,6-diaminopimelate ligase 1 [Candidatus Parcubacteria bacterium]|nr:MAG: UDP-N-acetylmuramoyl-L-alanyl-D-glutamate--2,6-diaminopimelate ligase 1 [Candidatus Parcubacteria bacterium]
MINFKNKIRKKIPKSFINFYHYLYALIGALIFKYPSKKIIVIGVTGTKGKTTTCYLIYKILNSLGIKTALSSSQFFYLGEEEIENKSRITMPGRLYLQEFLKKAVDNRCEVAVVEASSEGLMQNRHKFIDFDIAIFLNIHPEHIEHHGSFENYKKDKGKLFQNLLRGERKIFRGKVVKKTIIANFDDYEADYYLSFPAERKITFGFEKNLTNYDHLQITKFKLSSSGTYFNLNEDEESKKSFQYFTKLLGKQNLYNILATFCVFKSLDISLKLVKDILKDIDNLPGRYEIINFKSFKVAIDYAHTPDSIQELYKNILEIFKPKRMLCLISSAGGIRDKWKRPEIGKIAAKYCSEIIITDEDPYNEDPLKIIKEIEHGIKNYLSEYEFYKPYHIISDRKEAIEFLIQQAQRGDILVLIGKGNEKSIIKDNEIIPWDEKEIVLESYNKFLKSKSKKSKSE